MRKIMFNDKYGLTQAVLEGRKTMTRRIIKAPRTMEGKDVYGFCVVTYRTGDVVEVMALDEDEATIGNILPKYKVGEVVAVAQKYEQAGWNPDTLQQAWVNKPTIFPDLDEYTPLCGWVDLPLKYHKGWTSKMFVRADLMPHQIRITNVRGERLQDISEEDCLREGIRVLDEDLATHFARRYTFDGWWYRNRFSFAAETPREAFAALIDKISGNGTWNSNPYVFVYEFELVK